MEEVEILDYEEYFLLKENIIYKISIEKTKNEISIKHKNYKHNFNHEDLSTLTKKTFNSIDDVT